MGMKNSVPNPSWDRLGLRVLGKSWEQEYRLLPARRQDIQTNIHMQSQKQSQTQTPTDTATATDTQRHTHKHRHIHSHSHRHRHGHRRMEKLSVLPLVCLPIASRGQRARDRESPGPRITPAPWPAGWRSTGRSLSWGGMLCVILVDTTNINIFVNIVVHHKPWQRLLCRI